MFASTTIAGHLTRGAIAATLVAWALAHQSSDPGFAALAGIAALVAMRGCPLCWTIGLFETIGESMRVRRAGQTVRTMSCTRNGCRREEASDELLHA
jgi:hypothetical protein